MKTHASQLPNDQRGIALLLSLLLMAALTAAGIGASTVVINELRTTTSTDASIGAFYAADIGIERSLFTVANSRAAGLSLGETVNWSSTSYALPMVKFNLPAMPPIQVSGAQVDLEDSYSAENSKVFNLRKDQSIQLDLFSQSNPFSPSSTARYLYIRSPNLASLSPNAWLEVQWSYVRKSGPDLAVPNATIRLIATANLSDDGSTANQGIRINLLDGLVSPVGTSPVAIVNPEGITTSETTPAINDIAGWNVRIKALYADAPNITVRATDSAAGTYLIPGDVHIVARGEQGSARARLDALVPWKLPASGLFDYVVFSESNLDKPGS